MDLLSFFLDVFCTEPFRIPFAGKVDVCCFDKTGTLTSDDFLVEGVAGLPNHSDDVTSSAQCPVETVRVLATCQSLAQLDDGTLVGDPLEKATMKDMNWAVTKGKFTSKKFFIPLYAFYQWSSLFTGDSVVPRKGKGGYQICHRFHFLSALKRMSVICGQSAAGSSDNDYYVTTKGAPETLKTMVHPSKIVFNFTYNHPMREKSYCLCIFLSVCLHSR